MIYQTPRQFGKTISQKAYIISFKLAQHNPISLLEAWAESTYPNIEGYTLDRIDNDKGYSPENCRWLDRNTQAVNQRMQSNNKSGYTGVFWNPINKRWRCYITSNKQVINIGSFIDKIEAVLARDKYIVENNLPHKLSSSYAY